MKCIDLDPATQDFRIVDRRFVLESRFAEALVLRIRNAVAVARGEVALDTSAGFPYYPFVFGVKNPDLGVVRSLYVDYLRAIPGVALADVKCTLAADRTLDVSGYAIADDGTRIEIVNGNIYADGVKI